MSDISDSEMDNQDQSIPPTGGEPEFFRNFALFITHQLPVLIQQNASTQSSLNQILSTQLNQSPDFTPNSKSKLEHTMNSFSNAITEFTYDIDSNSTFENWFNRYADLFSSDAENLDDPAKIRLLLRKLDTCAHTKYINLILPKNPCDFTFKQTIEKLTEIFGKHESLFNTHYKCLQNIKNDSMDIFTYGRTVNKICEDFKLTELSTEQFKCLIFVMGLKSQSDLDIRTKLLTKLDSEHSTITLDKLITHFDRIRII